MRICLTYELKRNEFPIDYRRVVISLIKKALTECNEGKYLEKYYGAPKQKDYSFGVIFNKPHFLKEVITLASGNMKIIFSIESNLTGLILLNAFIGQKNKIFPLPFENYMVLKNISKEKEDVITESRAIFKMACGSCLCVRNHIKVNNKDIYYTVGQKEFEEQLKFVIKNGLKTVGYDEKMVDDFKFRDIKCKKVVVKHYGINIEASTGIFELEGNNRLLNYLLRNGMGSRRSSGFGMLELISQDLNRPIENLAKEVEEY